MPFNSLPFLIFFPSVLIIHYLLPHKIRYLWLLITSYIFYMYASPVFALLLLLSTSTTYSCGLFLSKCKNKKAKKGLLALCLLCNLGILVFYKYGNFFAESINLLFGFIGVSQRLPRLDILLPLGISFYTFQALGYIIDMYRGKKGPERNFFRYALFVGFFPQLISGPIQRSRDLLPQIHQPKSFNFDRIRKGLLLMLWGFFQKLVIADRAAILVSAVYDDPFNHVGLTFVVATLLFAVQIYCDFGGYTAIAIGAAQVLGFDFAPNFSQPYFAITIQDFWKRWHITLGTWFRDYVFVPLSGGLIKKKWRFRPTYIIASLTVWLLTGLWHGASWNFVIWGVLNGLMLMMGDIKRTLTEWLRTRKPVIRWFPEVEKKPFSARVLKCIITFFLINFTWVFFRASSLEMSLTIFRQAFASFNPWILIDGSLYRLGIEQTEFWTMIAAIVLLFVVDISHERGFSFRASLLKQQLWFRWLVYLGLIFTLLLLGIYGPGMNASSFIYFQF